MGASELGETVAVGLLAGPEDFARLRADSSAGLGERLWRKLRERGRKVAEGSQPAHPLGDLALLAAVDRRPNLAARVIEGALGVAHGPHWLHDEAGCMTLGGIHCLHELCVVSDWLWPALSGDQREGILGAVIAKGVENLGPPPDGVCDVSEGGGQLLLVRRLDKSDPHCLHPRAEQVNNWDLWFASGLYMAAALAERAWLTPDPAWPKLAWGRRFPVGYELDAERVARWKAIALERIRTALSTQLGPEGDYAEGISYAAYGSGPLLTGLIVLERVGRLDLFPPGLALLPRWLRNQFVADVAFGAANFNDAKLHATVPAPVAAHVARRTQDPELQGYALEAIELTAGDPDHLTLLGLDPDLPAEPVVLPSAALYKHTGTVIWRTAQDRSGVFFAMKSGAYGGAHQHRDRNTIFLSAYGEHLVVDTGDSRYADPPAIPHFADTHAHNCVLIDDRGQVGDNDNPTHGRIVEYRDDGAISTALADATACREDLAADHRRVVFLRPDVLVMADRVEGDCSELTWILHAYNEDGMAAWDCRDRYFVLKRPLAQLHVFLSEEVACAVTSTGTLDGAQEGVLRLEACVPGRGVTAALVPMRSDEPAPVCDWGADGALTISFRARTHVVLPGDAEVTVDGATYGV